MSEVTDLVLPLLQRIQSDLADVKRTLAHHGEILDAHTQKFEDLEIYSAHATGLGMQNKANLQAIRRTIKTMEQRLSTLETTS